MEAPGEKMCKFSIRYYTSIKDNPHIARIHERLVSIFGESIGCTDIVDNCEGCHQDVSHVAFIDDRMLCRSCYQSCSKSIFIPFENPCHYRLGDISLRLDDQLVFETDERLTGEEFEVTMTHIAEKVLKISEELQKLSEQSNE
jgi:hypothetical protein